MGRRFNPPPGWPEPESGWTPPPQWKPDVSWPPAPPQWTFWVYDDPTPVRQLKRAYLGPVGTHPVRKLVRGSLLGLFITSFIAGMFTTPEPAQSKQTAGPSPSSSAPPSSSPPPPPAVPAEAQRVTIDQIVDGQTLHVHVDDDGHLRKNAHLTLVLSGIAAPRGHQCHSEQSTSDLRAMLPAGARAYAAASGHTQARLWNASGTLINRSLVEAGDARAASADLAQAQAEAKSAQVGLWSTACVKPKPTPSPIPSEEPATPSPDPGTGDDGGDDSVPGNASAICRDGTYSYSQHRRGTCSHHGGVLRWL
jgi:endonuclease YncB( thermonuclease family)